MASAAAWEGPTAAELKAAGAEAIPGGVRVKGWVIQSHKGPILNAASLQRYEPPTLNLALPLSVLPIRPCRELIIRLELAIGRTSRF